MINSLTGLGALAVLLIFLFHASVFHVGDSISTLPGFHNGIVRSGDFGVGIFFSLWWLALVYIYVDKIQQSTGRRYRKFTWYRVAKVYAHAFVHMTALLTKSYRDSSRYILNIPYRILHG